jgi:hypothetical protein
MTSSNGERDPLPSAYTTYWTNGINALTHRVDGSPIFGCTYAKGKTTTLPNGSSTDRFKVPDHIVLSQEQVSGVVDLKRSMRIEQDFQDIFRLKISGKAGDDQFLSLSGDSELSYESDLFSDRTRTYEVAFFVCRTAEFNIPGTLPELDEDFHKNLNALATEKPPRDDPRWDPFFTQYGTHFVRRGTLGGFYVVRTSISNDVLKTTTESEVHASFQATFNDLVDSGQLSTDYYHKDHSSTTSSLDVEYTTEDRRGGDASTDKADFFKACQAWPVLLTLTWEPVSSPPELLDFSVLLVPDSPPDVRQAVQDATTFYTTPKATDDALLAGPLPVVVNESDVAPRDAFLVVHTTEARRDVTGLTTDGSQPPSARVRMSSSGEVRVAAWTMPVHKHEHYVVRTRPSSGPDADAGVDAVSFPLLGPDPATVLGDWTALNRQLPLEDTAAEDGFLLYQMRATVGQCTTTARIDDAPTAAALCSSTDGRSYAAFTLPLAQGARYRLAYAGSADAEHTVDWVALKPPLRFGQPAAREVGIAYQDDQDGFLVVTTNASGTTEVRIGPDHAPGAKDVVAAVAVTDRGEGQSLLVPVPRTTHYLVLATAGDVDTDPSVRIVYLPLLRAERPTSPGRGRTDQE